MRMETKRHLVQILVVVASIQMRTLKAEEETVSMRTSFGHGLVGPKRNILHDYTMLCIVSSTGNYVNNRKPRCGKISLRNSKGL